ncbi:MAG: hypothetical protein ACU0CA_15925 [Paracoccaceae bacterium]
MLYFSCLFRLTFHTRLLIYAAMTSWSKYWARIKAAICIAVAFGIFLFPAPYAHADIMMKNGVSYDMSAALSGSDHQRHSVGSDIRSVIVDDTHSTTDNNHDGQYCPASCLSVVLNNLFTTVAPQKTSVQGGLVPPVLSSADVSGFLRPPLT